MAKSINEEIIEEVTTQEVVDENGEITVAKESMISKITKGVKKHWKKIAVVGGAIVGTALVTAKIAAGKNNYDEDIEEVELYDIDEDDSEE